MRNEIKIRFEEPEYKVDLEKGTVECFLKYEVLYPDFLQGMFFLGEKVYFWTHGVAKVNSGDVFDENIGKKISLAKAEKKAYKKKSREEEIEMHGKQIRHHSIQKSKKQYSRKDKHKNNY